MTPNPDCTVCQGTGKVVTDKPKVSIGFFDYTNGMACPRCEAVDYNGTNTVVITDVPSNLLEDRVARIERHLGLPIGDSDT
jgi:hypothetical protein